MNSLTTGLLLASTAATLVPAAVQAGEPDRCQRLFGDVNRPTGPSFDSHVFGDTPLHISTSVDAGNVLAGSR